VVSGNRVNSKHALVKTVPPSGASVDGSSAVRYEDVERGVVADDGVTLGDRRRAGQIKLVGPKPVESPVKPDSQTAGESAREVAVGLNTLGTGTVSPSHYLRRLAAIEQTEPVDDLPRGSQLAGHLIRDKPAEGVAGDAVGALRLTSPYIRKHFFGEAIDGPRTIDALSQAPCHETANFTRLAERGRHT